MSDWGWVGLGYVVVYGVIAAYAATVLRRLTKARRRTTGATGAE